MHWAKEFLKGQTSSTFTEYFFKYNVKGTAMALISFFVAMFAFLATEPAFSWAAAYGAFSVGYMSNSIFNTGE